MKRDLAPALFMLSLCAVLGGAREAGAQRFEAPAFAMNDSTLTAVQAPGRELEAVTIVAKQDGRGAPVIVPASPILLRDARQPARMNAGLAAPAPVDWRMPTSRSMIIGGSAAAVLGLALVGGDTGAIIAMSGTAVAVYGLYLHYNR